MVLRFSDQGVGLGLPVRVEGFAVSGAPYSLTRATNTGGYVVLRQEHLGFGASSGAQEQKTGQIT